MACVTQGKRSSHARLYRRCASYSRFQRLEGRTEAFTAGDGDNDDDGGEDDDDDDASALMTDDEYCRLPKGCTVLRHVFYLSGLYKLDTTVPSKERITMQNRLEVFAKTFVNH
jgi:hypothetical protein